MKFDFWKLTVSLFVAFVFKYKQVLFYLMFLNL